MRIFSTFSGIGGFEIGIHNAYREALRRGQGNQEKNDETGQRLVASQGQDTGITLGWPSAGAANQLDQGPLCVGYSEIDKYAIKVYEKQFPGVKNYGDITKINEKELPDFDCLVGGFPCQAFSIAGKRRGFDDTRGTLFFDLARILRAKQPRYFVFENVKGLLSHDQGNTFRTIITTIDELGYDCQWQVINSKDFGVPQNRERVYIVGHLRGTARPEVFPISSGDGEDTEVWAEAKNAAANISNGANWHGAESERPNIRRLTPKECERLQGFPDDWTKYGTDGEISDTQRYKMCGNAVTTNVVQAVFEKIFNQLFEGDVDE